MNVYITLINILIFKIFIKFNYHLFFLNAFLDPTENFIDIIWLMYKITDILGILSAWYLD